jgi:enoyl-CoA hydratase/carnithine racemase
LPALVGRGRAFEILLGGNDYDGALAEKYGYVNRAVPDADFDAFVNAYATRVSGWNHQALGEIKSFINKYTRLPDAEFPLHSDAFWSAATRTEFRTTASRLFDKGLQERGPLEYHLGDDIAAIAQD